MELRVVDRLHAYFIDCGLSGFAAGCAVDYLQSHLGAQDGEIKLKRVIGYLITQLNKSDSSIPRHPYQKGCPNIVEGLTATPFWDTSLFPWVTEFENKYKQVQNEFLALQDANFNGFQPYRAPKNTSQELSSCREDNIGQQAVDSGAWNVCYLYLHGLDFRENQKHFPVTISLLNCIPNGHYQHSLFSVLAPNTHIIPHHGPTNRKLRCQLPIIIPQNDLLEEESPARLRVADESLTLEEGKIIIFDDSFEHEAINTSNKPRVVLIFDIWHPEFTREEVKFLQYINKYEMKALQKHQDVRAPGNTVHELRDTTSIGSDSSSSDFMNTVSSSSSSDFLKDTFLTVIAKGREAAVLQEHIWGVK